MAYNAVSNGRIFVAKRLFMLKIASMAKKIIITEGQLRQFVNEENMTKSDVDKIIKDIIAHDKGLESRVKNIAADVIKNLFRSLWQKNGMYDSDIRR